MAEHRHDEIEEKSWFEQIGKLAPVLMALALVLGVIANWGNIPTKVAVLEKKTEVLEETSVTQRESLAVIKNDIGYIKEKVAKL